MGEGSFRLICAILWYSLPREDSRGDHYGLEPGLSVLMGVKVEIRDVRREDEMSNHLAIVLGVGQAGGVGTVKFLSAIDMAFQSRRYLQLSPNSDLGMATSIPLFPDWMRKLVAVAVVRRQHQHQEHQNTYYSTAASFTTTDTFSNQLLNNSTFQMCLDPRQACWL